MLSRDLPSKGDILGEIWWARRLVGLLLAAEVHSPPSSSPYHRDPPWPCERIPTAPPLRCMSNRSGAGPRKCLLAALSPDAGRLYRLSLDSRENGQRRGYHAVPADFIKTVFQWGLRPKSGHFIVGRQRRSLWIVGRWQTISQDIRGQAWVDIRTFGRDRRKVPSSRGVQVTV